jgi:NAD+ synthase
LDLCLYGKNHGVGASEVADAAGLTADQVRRVWEDIDRKRQTTRYLHLAPQLAGPVPELGG